MSISSFDKSKKQSGFTLIEMIVVIVIIGILAGMGIVRVIKLDQSRLVENASKNFAGTLLVAKSRAFAGVRPAACVGQLLDWRVVVSSQTSYKLSTGCGNSITPTIFDKQTVTLPTGVTVSLPIDSVIFPIRKGIAVMGTTQASSPQQFVFQGNGLTRIVTVYDDGRVATK